MTLPHRLLVAFIAAIQCQILISIHIQHLLIKNINQIE